MNAAQAVWLVLMAGVLVGLMVGWWLGGVMVRRSLASAERSKAVGWEAKKIMYENELSTYQAGRDRFETLYLEECRRREEQVAEERRKREEQFVMIEGIQKERDRWKDIFWQCSSEHGVAQEYMIRLNQHFARICGKSPDAKMPAIRKAFEEKYGAAAKPQIAERIARGQPGLPEPDEAPITTPSAENALRAPVVVAKDDPNA